MKKSREKAYSVLNVVFYKLEGFKEIWNKTDNTIKDNIVSDIEDLVSIKKSKNPKKKTFTTYDDTVLKDGKKYYYSNILKDDKKIKNHKCKISISTDTAITIYDYETKNDYVYTYRDLVEDRITFKKMF
jgi:hypothetical protein